MRTIREPVRAPDEKPDPLRELASLPVRCRGVMGDRGSGFWSSTLVWTATVLMSAAAVALIVSLLRP